MNFSRVQPVMRKNNHNSTQNTKYRTTIEHKTQNTEPQ